MVLRLNRKKEKQTKRKNKKEIKRKKKKEKRKFISALDLKLSNSIFRMLLGDTSKSLYMKP